MEHNKFRLLVQSSLFGELTENEKNLLKEHLLTCSECRKELGQQQEILSMINKQKKPEVNENLLREARAQLRGAMRSESYRKRWSISEKLISVFATRPGLALGAAALLLIGFFIGSLVLNKSGNSTIITDNNNIREAVNSGLQPDVRIRNVSFIDADASDGEIEFTFDAVKPVHIKGKVNDPVIQNVLTYSMLNEQNPGSRLNSINAIYSDNKINIDNEFKSALVTVMMTDKNPGIRREAMKLIEQTRYDEEIKSAFIYVLLNDLSTAMRIDALNHLIESSGKGVELNNNDLKIIKEKTLADNNNYIRLKAKTLIEEYN